ncbi:glycosyltransferase [Streptomyces sp. NPDC020898]|uniref:glycosyltransferase n=1 Tax=Streptomyces sp. NPDC020898 TaxID=3365101 RepID=UPI0037B28E63
MIVKNESRVIERCLSSVRHLIDHWVICDTGSTDGTQDLIRRTLDGIPGELHEEPWVDFGHNRTGNIQRALGKADYLLTLDADHVMRQDAPLPRLTATSYMLRYDTPGTQHRFKHLMWGDRLWRYEGVTHEYPCTDETDGPDVQENLDVLVIEDHADGGCRSDKFERDARLAGGGLLLAAGGRPPQGRRPGAGRPALHQVLGVPMGSALRVLHHRLLGG